MKINGKNSKDVSFECFFFKRIEGTVKLHGQEAGRSDYVVTSPIVDIHFEGERVYVETHNSLYCLTGKKAKHAKGVKEFLSDNMSEEEFFERCVANKLPDPEHGWFIY